MRDVSTSEKLKVLRSDCMKAWVEWQFVSCLPSASGIKSIDAMFTPYVPTPGFSVAEYVDRLFAQAEVDARMWWAQHSEPGIWQSRESLAPTEPLQRGMSLAPTYPSATSTPSVETLKALHDKIK